MRSRALRLEASLLLRQRFFRWTLLAFALLCSLAAAEGLARMAQQRHTVERLHETEERQLQAASDLARRLDRQQATAGPFRDPRIPANFVRLVLSDPAVKPLLPASALNVTQADVLPFYFLLNTGPSNKSTSTYEYGNPEIPILGRLDLSLILLFVLPLFLAIAGHSIGSFERQAGFDSLLKVVSPAPARVYARRLLLAALPLIAIYLFVATATIVCEAVLDHAGAAMTLRSGLSIVLTACLYSSCWLAILLFVVRRSSTPAAALTSLSIIWAVICLLVPVLASEAAARLYPTLPRAEYVNRMRIASDEAGRHPERAARAYLPRHTAAAGAAAAGKPLPAGIAALAGAEYADAVKRDLDNEIGAAQEKQRRVLRAFAIVSPLLLAQAELDRLSGEDFERQREFLRSVHEQIGALRMYYEPYLADNRQVSGAGFAGLEDYPRYRFPGRSGGRWIHGEEALIWIVSLLAVAGLALKPKP